MRDVSLEELGQCRTVNNNMPFTVRSALEGYRIESWWRIKWIDRRLPRTLPISTGQPERLSVANRNFNVVSVLEKRRCSHVVVTDRRPGKPEASWQIRVECLNNLFFRNVVRSKLLMPGIENQVHLFSVITERFDQGLENVPRVELIHCGRQARLGLK